MCSRTVLLILGLALSIGAGSALAEEPEPDAATAAPTPAPSPGAETAPLLHGRLAITLEEAIKMGLENNLDVQVQRYSPLIAEMDRKSAWGAFDPTLFAGFGYLDGKTPTSSALAGSRQIVNRETDGDAGLRGILPILGTEYEAKFQAKKASTNFAIANLSPEYTSGWNLSVTQPVLRDLIWNQPWFQVQTSRLALESSREGFRGAVMDSVEAIEQAYWQLIAQDEERRVAQKSLETAKALLDQTQTQYEVGVVSKVEVTEAEAGLSRREVNLIRAENQYRNQQDVLINLVMGRGLRAASTLELMPTDRPEEFVAFEINVERAVVGAFENRPELEQARRNIETQRVQLAFERNQWLPSLDGVVSFAQSGLSGRTNPDSGGFGGGVDPRVLGGYGHSINDYEDNPTFSARGLLSVPFPNTSASGKVSRAKFALRQAQSEMTRLEQSIILDVRAAARNLEAAQEGIVAARAAETAAAEQLRAERIRLEYGESTPFDVLQREEDLVDRENELISAFQAYRTSVTALDRAQGTILRNRNIRIAEVGALR